MIAYLNGEFIPKEEIHISPDDRGFLFADGAYEVIRCYHGRLFQADAHIDRLKRSIHSLRIEFDGIGQLYNVAKKLIKVNQLIKDQAIVYLQITRGAAPRTHRFPPKDTPATIYAFAVPFKPHQDELDYGTKIILVADTRWSRCDIKSISLLANILAHQQAVDSGATESIFIRDGIVTEGTHTNFCGIFDGKLVTAPQSNYILAGITRGVVFDLCRQLNIQVVEFPILETDLKKADELILVGTTVEITPIVQFDDWKVGSGEPGVIARKLQNAFYELIKNI